MVRVLAVATALLGALSGAAPADAAIDVNAPPSAPALVQMWQQAEAGLAAAAKDGATYRAEPADPNPLVEARRELLIADADYRFRDAARTEQVVVYAVAADPGIEGEVEDRLPVAEVAPMRGVVAGLRSLWRAAGIDDFSQVRVRHNRSIESTATIPELLTYYQDAGGRYSIDWTYLASINYVESDFGRVLGPSSAGALGPMQFMPATWKDYGAGGDIRSPHDSIQAAARYLHAMGGPGNMDRAIYRYNNDSDYVASIDGFAAAFRADSSWVDRLYYWSTAG